MTKEERQLLLKDLCTRLLYGVKGTVEIEVSTGEYSIESEHLLFMEKEIDVELLGINKETEEIEVYPLNNNIDLDGYDYAIDDFIPYLRPMSNMTTEDIEKLSNETHCNFGWSRNNIATTLRLMDDSTILTNAKAIEWLNSHCFDYRGLIEKGLALEAPEGMYEK